MSPVADTTTEGVAMTAVAIVTSPGVVAIVSNPVAAVIATSPGVGTIAAAAIVTSPGAAVIATSPGAATIAAAPIVTSPGVETIAAVAIVTSPGVATIAAVAIVMSHVAVAAAVEEEAGALDGEPRRRSIFSFPHCYRRTEVLQKAAYGNPASSALNKYRSQRSIKSFSHVFLSSSSIASVTNSKAKNTAASSHVNGSNRRVSTSISRITDSPKPADSQYTARKSAKQLALKLSGLVRNNFIKSKPL